MSSAITRSHTPPDTQGRRALLTAPVGLYLLVLPMPPALYNGSILLLAALGLGLLLWQRGALLAQAPVRDVLLVFACLWLPMLLACIDAVDAGRAQSSTALYLRFALAGLFIVWVLREASALRWLRLATLGFCALWTADALFQAVAGFNMLGFPYEGGQLQGLFYPRYRLGLVLTVFTPLILDYLAERGREQAAWWLLLLPLAAVVGLTLHRNSWVIFVLGCALYATYRLLEQGWRPRSRVVLASLVAVALVGAALATQPSVTARLVHSVSAPFTAPEELEAQLGQRPDIWRTGVAMFADNWLNGVGPRGFREAYTTYAGADDYWLAREPPTVPAHPHQLLLEILVETGLIGALGYVGMLGYLGWRYRRADAATRARAAPWLLSLLLALWPLNIHKAFYGFFVATLVWWLLAVTIAALHARPAPPR